MVFIIRILVILTLPIIAYIGLRRFAVRYALNQRQFNMLLLVTTVLVVVLVLIVLGRIPIQFIAAPIMLGATFLLRNLPWLIRLVPMLQMFRDRKAKSAYGAAGETGNSVIRTRYLVIELDHNTGEMDGEVLLGKHKGAKLSSLDLGALIELLEECEQDNDSKQVLEAYLDRTHSAWRGSDDKASTSSGSTESEAIMTESLALDILGLEKGASREDVVKAHRHLMQKMHPDRGGSDYLAQRINAARDFLVTK